MKKINILEPFLSNVQKNPSKIAIVDHNGARATSYGELKEKSLRMASYLQSLRLPEHSFIALCLPKGVEYIIAEFGIWMSGHAIVPINDRYPQEKIDYILEHSKSPFIIDCEFFAKAMESEPKGEILEVDGDTSASIFFTSGSLGNPKGIIHTYEAFDVAFHNHGHFVGLNENTVFGGGAPFYFIAYLCYVHCIFNNGTAHIFGNDIMKDTDLMYKYFQEYQINYTFMSPSMLRNCKHLPSCIKTVLAGSEKLSNVQPEGYRLLNGYGMTETFALISLFEVDKAYENTPIGKAVPTCKVTIRDEEGNVLPPGKEGEICVEGKFAKCYFEDPERTAELYRGGVLHTGDIGVVQGDGNLYYVNRKDYMVKINGQRVEPNEVETALKKIDGIKDAVVKGFTSDINSHYLCAYYISEQNLTDEMLRLKLLERLPAYMVPSFFLKMEKFPINMNGKLDRKSLLPPDKSTLQAAYTAPTTDLERQLCKAYEKVLKMERIGIDDDFIRLGGDSIRVVMLQQLCRELPISARMIFENRTPRLLAVACERYQHQKLELLKFYPLSQTQMGVYVECMNRPGEIAYNNPKIFVLPADIDLEKVTDAITATVAAHPYLTTRLSLNEKGDPRQTRPASAKFHPIVEELCEKDFQSHQKELVQPFDLLKEPLFRLRLFKTEKATYLFMDIHHIIFDGASFEILIDDFNRAFAGETLSVEHFTGCEVAQEELFERQSERYTAAADWYTKKFGTMELNSLPLPDKKGKSINFSTSTLHGFDYENLRLCCEREGVTMNVLTSAAFGYLLSSYTNEQEALFATIYNGRTDLRTNHTIAMMVKTLPVYCKWDITTTMHEYLQQVKSLLLQTMQYDIFSYAELAATNSCINSQILFAYQGFLDTPSQLFGAPYRDIDLLQNATGEKLALQLFLLPNNTLELKAEYQNNLYSETFMQRFMECYRQVLSEFCIQKKLCDIHVLPPQQELELDSFNPLPSFYDKSQTIVSLFRKVAAQYPDRKALTFNDEVITYYEVDRMTERIAQYLAAQHIGRGDVVSVLVPRSTFIATASFGVLKTAACYQPLDPTYPAERLNFMMKDAKAKYLITNRELRHIVNEYTGPVLYIEDIPFLPETSQPLPEPLPEDRLTLLYTSGSTGIPKGCQITHANLVAHCHWFHHFYDLSPESCVGAFASYGFDANMQDMYPALTVGANCCIIGEDVRLDFIALNDYLTKNKVTDLFMTTQVGRQFAIDYPTHPTLRHLAVGGEALVPFTPPISYQFFNGYGPTECTICSTSYPVTHYEENMSIGRPVANQRCYIVDPYGHRLPVGAIGEICIAGPQVSLGYLNHPELTQKAFVKNPFCPDNDHQLMYHTGDIGRYRNDGQLEYIGRKDNQVKIRGFRIELSEIERVIQQFPGIDDTTVAAFNDPNGGKFIAAYIVASQPIDVKALNNFIRSQKPPYMVPAVTMQIEEIPLNQNMKVNHHALPEPKVQLELEKNEKSVLNALELQLQEMIGAIVHLEQVPLHTELSFLGLTSISAIKLSATIYKRFKVKITAKYLIGEATLHNVENKILEEWLNHGTHPEAIEAKIPTEAIEASPLTYAQQGVYYDCMKRPAEIIYNIPTMLSFSPELQAEDLEKAVRQLLAGHPSLQSHFEIRDKEVMQLRDHLPLHIQREELSEKELTVFKKSFVRPFELSKAPLFRIAIIRTEKRLALLSDIHHLIFDGASMAVFIQQLKDILEGNSTQGESYSYFEYSLNERKQRDTVTYQANHDFFHQMLSTCEKATELPADLNGKVEDGQLQEVVRSIADLPLKKFSQQWHTTPAAVCLAAAGYTLSRYVNAKEVYLCTISNGRQDIRTTNTFGMFVKTLPIALHVKDQEVKNWIHESGKILADTIEHEAYPFSLISSDYHFTPSVVYAYQLEVLNERTINGKPFEIEGLELKIAKFKLAIHIEERDGAPAIVLQYNDALYSTELVESFAASMAYVLDEMMQQPHTQVRHLSLVDPLHAAQLETFRDTGAARSGLFHEGIERQATLQPDKMALLATDSHFTYKELNGKANRIAHALIERGVHPGDTIVLLLPRTSRIILSMFGVMKAGAAYIPCDPKFPEERISQILSDSEASCIITTQEYLHYFKTKTAIDVEDLLENRDESNPHTTVTPDDLAYLIYTSGSTGKPKGVQLRHAGITNYLCDDERNTHVHALVTDAHTFLSVTTVSFDMSLKEIGTTLYNGLTLVFANEQQANDPILLSRLFKETHADAFNATPSRMLQYIQLPMFREALRSCKIIMCGGEKYPDQLLARLHDITNARIFNTYGPTEITVSSNCQELTHTDCITIGYPLLNCQEFIVDSDGNELPPQVVGELYIGGAGVARGYKNLNQLTAERFINYHGTRVYKSGDFARWTTDGRVVLLGRTDNLIKLRGLRIELEEIESCIQKYPGIQSAVVTVKKINSTEHLCAYFTTEKKIDIADLKRQLKTTLTQYMIPTTYLQMEQLPLTPNGKIDTKALPVPQSDFTSQKEKPANDTEQFFCKVFAKILQVKEVGATDNFFQLGGTSLSVVSIVIDANNAGYHLAYGDVFSHPSPRQLAAMFTKGTTQEGDDYEISQYDYNKFLPLLKQNQLKTFQEGERQMIKRVLLTGATGFLGIHLLQALLEQGVEKVYCLLRRKESASVAERLKSILRHYFGESYESRCNSRVVAVEGDLTQKSALTALEDQQIDTVFHCAANVKHFASDNQIEQVNVNGVQTVLDFCEKTGARLVHTSTMSIGGLVPMHHPLLEKGFTEDSFYVKQTIKNKYVQSKFLAERLILESILTGKVSAKIMRVGNLSARNADGKFQMNYNTNSFVGRLKSFHCIGKCPYEMLDIPLEFSPVDEVAKAITLLATTPKECTVFHPYNHHFILLGDVLQQMSQMGLTVTPTEFKDFQQAKAAAEADPAKIKTLCSIIAYQDLFKQKTMVPLKKNNTYTLQILYRMGYHWPITSKDYVQRFLEELNALGFFNNDHL